MPDFVMPDPDHPPIPKIPDLPKRVPWLEEWNPVNVLWRKRPQLVQILVYLDAASFKGGPFGGLQHAIHAVESDPWPWAKFIVTTANRQIDRNADEENVRLTDLDLNRFDEIWLFGISSNTNQLSASERTALEAFMDSGGGVLTTGDHDKLGAGLSGSAKRIRDLRDYSNSAPSGSSPDWNTTIRDGNGDGTYTFVEQSDAVPQTIRPRYRYQWTIGPFGSHRKYPHPLLCAESGVLKKLPDHQHEGQVTIPEAFPVTDWPKAGAFQPKPEVVAWGRILDPAARNAGGEFPVIGAYDGHAASVGRIVADSTWHHWFDINMEGFDTASSDYRDITSYFQNVAAWLAPKDKQAGMRDGVFWHLLHQSEFQQHQLAKLPLAYAITLARDALGRSAPHCLVSGWIFELLPVSFAARAISFDTPPDVPLPIEDVILVEALTAMQEGFDIESGILRPPNGLVLIPNAIREAGLLAAKRLETECEAMRKSASSLVKELSPRTKPTPKKSTKKAAVRKPAVKTGTPVADATKRR